MTSGASVVMVNYRSVSQLADCLTSLASEPIARIVVVNNELCDRKQLDELLSVRSNVSVLHQSANVGFAAAVNQGVAALTMEAEDCVWVLNPDTRVRPGATRLLLSALNEGRADIVSPTLTTGAPGETSLWFSSGSIDYQRGRSIHSTVSSLEGSGGDLVRCSFLTGTALMMRSATWDRLGGLREDLFLYWEDADLCVRAARIGMRIAVVTESQVWHAVSASSKASSPKGRSAAVHYYMQRNRILALHGAVSMRRLLGWPGALECMRLAGRAFFDGGDRVSKLTASLEGLRDGIKGVRGPRP